MSGCSAARRGSGLPAGRGDRAPRRAVRSVAAAAALASAVASVLLVAAASVDVWVVVALAAADVVLALGAVIGCWGRGLGGLRLERGFEDPVIGMLMVSPQMQVLRANTAVGVLLDRDAGGLVGRSILEFTHPDDVARSIAWTEAKLTGAQEQPLLKRYVRPDGSIVEVAVTTVLVELDGWEPYFLSQLRNVTEERRAERQRTAIAELGHRALRCTDPIALIGEAMRTVREILDTAGCVTTRRLTSGEVRLIATDRETFEFTLPAGQPSQTQFTLQADEPVISNDLLSETRFPVPPVVFGNALRRGISVPVPQRGGARHVIVAHRHEDAREFCVDDARFLEAVAHVIGGALDRAETEHELRRRAMQDPLTGLANRTLLAGQLAAELRHAKRLGHRVCLIAIELDRFKTVNDTLGHTVGDSLLRALASRLTTCVREEDLVARAGGDEFAVICTRTDNDHAIAQLAKRILDTVRQPFEVDNRDVYLTASIGIAVSDHGQATAEELLRDADAAVSRAKELGGGRFEAFDIALRHRLITRMALESDLRHALDREQLELHYQPLIDLADEHIVGFEALLRWRHPEHGLIAPDQFISIAEQTGLIIEIGNWVLSTVCEQLALFPDQIELAANLSALQLRPELVGDVQQLIAYHQLTPRRLVLEITESLVLDPRAKPIVERLRALGVRLALDDFGTGYSSLGSLQQFPLDVIKLDRTLIDALTDGRGIAVLRAAVELGRELAVDVIAEGIEHRTQLTALRTLGCPLGQGYLFAKPLPLPDARHLLTRHHRHHHAHPTPHQQPRPPARQPRQPNDDTEAAAA